MSDWWSNKLGTKAAPVQHGIVVPPSYYQPQLPFQQPQPFQAQRPQVAQQPLPPQQSDSHDRKQQVTLSDALRRTDLTGPAARAEGHLSCPGCGSRTGYTEYSGGSGGSPGGHQAAPHCFECGYSTKFSQGEQSNWA